MTVKIYKIGGCVRDQIMGIKPHDIDYTCVCDSYEEMRQYILSRGIIFIEKPEYLTIRAKINNQVADFVMARKDGQYYDGRRPSIVEPGSLLDDQLRRDLTINSIAQDENGTIYDPFNGVADIAAKAIRCVGNTSDRFNEDSLRMLRAIRFSITKGFRLSDDIVMHLLFNANDLATVSNERIREELHKCFAFDTLLTLKTLEKFREIRDYVFSVTDIWLQPTNKDR